MKRLAFKVLDYFYENDRARKVWFFVAWAGMLACILPLGYMHFAFALFFGLLIHWHGLVDGSKAAVEGYERGDK